MSAIENHKCPCCGAPLIYGGNALNCESCGNSYSVETMEEIEDSEREAAKGSGYNWDEYIPRNYEDKSGIKLSDYSCPSCGAHITGDDNLGATVCPYCGGSVVVKGQFEGNLQPDYIIPFKFDKKEAMKKFEEAYKKAPFLPDEFKNKKKIEEMAGVYVPFWMFDCDCTGAVTYSANRVSMWSDSNYNYTKTDYYRLFRKGSVGFANIPVDGSRKTDDTYMEAIEPYDYSEAVDFKTEYLSGFMAEKYDVDEKESVVRANERVEKSTIKALDNTTGAYAMVTPLQSSVSFENGKIRYALLPVWMLNIKYKDKNFKFAINGQTGKVVGEYPVDNGKKWKYFGKVLAIMYVIAAIVAFVLLY